MGRNRNRSSRGQGLVEYALIIVLVVVVVILVLVASGTSLSEVFNSIIAALGFDRSCTPVAAAGGNWDSFENKYWRGGISENGDQYTVCPLCGGLLDGYSGSDYDVNLSGVQVTNSGNTRYGYGVTFRATLSSRGLNGYTFEIEQTNKNKTPVMYFNKWVNGVQIKPSLAITTLPADFSWSDPPDMRVSVVGDTFIAYLDGVPVLNVTDSTYQTGGAGVVANAGTTLNFSDLLLNRPECLENRP